MDLKGQQIAIVNWWPTMHKDVDEATGIANARLIAAAPDLLKVCLRFHQCLTESSEFYTKENGALLENAIKKATENV